ncbi:hypothetical protein BGZ63DRAFT_394797 [Mariannaea sp. PMI_226]|nr:hypothetical protein BGZ63DRAFT_394797 [Mariannaea sp. PMI_226]
MTVPSIRRVLSVRFSLLSPCYANDVSSISRRSGQFSRSRSTTILARTPLPPSPVPKSNPCKGVIPCTLSPCRFILRFLPPEGYMSLTAISDVTRCPLLTLFQAALLTANEKERRKGIRNTFTMSMSTA